MADPPVKTCPECKKKKVEKQISLSAFSLKGDGWYVTEYGTKKGKSDSSSESTPAKKSKGKSENSSDQAAKKKTTTSQKKKPASKTSKSK